MHFPDSVLSPTTSAVAGAAMLPVWTMAGRRVRETLGTRQVPMLALGAAFCFTIMLFNLPALGGTTAHPVAGTLIAVMLGPWAAVIAISVALAIQAVFFGDGGLLAYGANCFVMAYALPFAGYSLYRLLSARLPALSPRRALCAGIGAYVGLNLAAALVALLLGIQPLFFHEPNGHALYFPFGLKVTLPAMLGTHLIVAGPAEAIVTAFVVRYLQTAGLPLYGVAGQEEAKLPAKRRRAEALWIGLLTLIALSPLGLLAQGDAWGEWDAKGTAEQIQKVEGREYVPQGIAQAEEHGFKGLPGLQDYASNEGKNRLGYIGAGLLGVGTIVGLILLGGRLLAPSLKNRGGEKPDWLPPLAKGRVGVGSSPSPCSWGEGREGGPNALPDWLRTSHEADPQPEASPRKSNPFVERTLGELATKATEALHGERWAQEPGLLQRLDPRAKALALGGMIVATAAVHQPITLVALYTLTLLFGSASRLPLGLMLRRVWLAVPLFVGLIALPAALNTVTPGRELFVLWRAPHLALTAPGLTLAAVLLLRAGVAVSCALLLTATTRWNDLLRALRSLFVPRLFVTVLAMTYRYLITLLQAASEMFVARRSRTVGRIGNAAGRQFVGLSIVALFGRTLALSDEVHDAMLSRGFTGEVRTLSVFRWQRLDTLWLFGAVLLACSAFALEYLH